MSNFVENDLSLNQYRTVTGKQTALWGVWTGSLCARHTSNSSILPGWVKQEGSRYFHHAGDVECLSSTGEGLAGSSLWLQPLRSDKDQWQFGGLRQRQREWELPVATMPCLLKQLLLLWTINNMEKQNKVHQKKEMAFWRESLSVLKLIWSKQLLLNKDF